MTLEEARHWFAEDLRVAAGISSKKIIAAFARVPRERFVGSPPWRVGMRLARMGGEPFGYQSIEADPRVLYHDVVVALDEEQEINNGQPSLWARILEEADLQAGAHILHLGCGTGYYSAVLAEIVGANGSVAAVEIDDNLAERACEALGPWPNVSVTCGDGLSVADDRYDAIIVSAGVTHPLDSWLDSLAPIGRLVFPLTLDVANWRSGSGGMLLISRTADSKFAARFLVHAAFIHFHGGRDPQANENLLQAFRNGLRQAVNVRSLRRETHTQDENCWLHAQNFCLSYCDP